MRNQILNAITIILLIVCTNKFIAQNDYYWYKNQKVFLEKIPNKKYLILEGINDTNSLKQELNLPNIKIHKFNKKYIMSGIKPHHEGINFEKKWAVIEKENVTNTILTNKQKIIYETPFYKTYAQREIGLSHLFYVKLLNTDDLGKLETLALAHHVEILGNNNFMPLWFTLSCSKQSTGNSLDMANLFYETGFFAASEPDLMTDNITQCVNDPLFNTQWGLNNPGGIYGTLGIDIKACPAWQITEGSNNIIVAVIDEGIEMNHPDLTNMHSISFDTETPGISSSQVWGNHGTAVAGVVGANSNNNIGVSGIAPNCPLMSISNKLELGPNLVQNLANGINFAWQNGASVISNSWGLNASSTIIDNAITAALTQGRNGLGCVVVFASGNLSAPVLYPANSSFPNQDVLAVGRITGNGVASQSGFGLELDVVAPGWGIQTTDRQGANGYSIGDNTVIHGTSFSCPAVAAVAALVLSVNHNLTEKQVVDIIESTAQKFVYPYALQPGRPNGTWNINVGYGCVDANAAVMMAQSMCNTTNFDYFSKDGYLDFGFEPNPALPYQFNTENPNIYNSIDIWIRNQPDGLTNSQSQNPEFSITNDPNQLNYVYVRVRNRGCQSSFTDVNLELRWSKAATNMAWPNNWNGSTYLDPPIYIAQAGNLIGSLSLPSIPPGGETILSFPWNPPNPTNYSGVNGEPWHFCLLSRILTPLDPMTFTEGSFIPANVQNNNNIAWKNLTVVDNIFGKKEGGICPKDIMEGIGVAVGVSNPDDVASTYNIIFKVPQEELDNSILKEGKVNVALDKQLYHKWVEGGKQGSGFTEIVSPPDTNTYIVSKRKMFEINSTTASFNNITLNPHEFRTTSMMVLYPTTPVSGKQEFQYDIIQTKPSASATSPDQLIGGVHYDIKKPNCSDKKTSAGSDITIEQGTSTILTAKFMECAEHTWFKENGRVIGKDSSVTVSPNKTQTYTLKTISAEGCFSESKITVTVSDSSRIIKEITPNPANSIVTIKYKIKNAPIAQIRIVSVNDPSVTREYNLGNPSNKIVLNISDLPPSVYAIILICDGIIEDSKTLIIQ